MEIPEINDFALVGGTALSLLYGHRKSEDLDLFSTAPFENDIVINALKKKYKQAFNNRSNTPRLGIFCFINNVKVDIVRHPHHLLLPIVTKENIRMFSEEDIIDMKVQAVLGRGKKKDFWDIAELLQHYTVDHFVQYHQEKYNNQNLLITVPQAISYFHDAEESEDPVSLKKQTWEKVKKVIGKKVSDYLK
jgi:predicted nucleotidyltransferase component of viral defense system